MDATDYELLDLFDWQEEARGMISQMEFVRRVDVQAETVERYVREGRLVPGLAVPMSQHRTFKSFKEETVQAYARQYGWTLIGNRNRKDLFLEMVRRMDMSYSYKPVLTQAILRHADEKGRVKLSDISDYFRAYYERRRAGGGEAGQHLRQGKLYRQRGPAEHSGQSFQGDAAGAGVNRHRAVKHYELIRKMVGHG